MRQLFGHYPLVFVENKPKYGIDSVNRERLHRALVIGHNATCLRCLVGFWRE